jgi:ABC-type multidrug transport system fused ATPase/permease subunit
VLLRIFCDFHGRVGRLEVLKSDHPVLVGETPVRNETPLSDGDLIQIDASQALRCNFAERVLEEEHNVISRLDVRDLVCRFKGGGVGVDGVSFSATRGEMICVMGASGCGKSSLLRALAGQFPPVRGDVLFNNLSLYENFEALKQYVTYIPQFDAFDEHLTIGENLGHADGDAGGDTLGIVDGATPFEALVRLHVHGRILATTGQETALGRPE